MSGKSAHLFERVVTFARPRHWIVSIAQLRDLGVGDDQVQSWVRCGRLHRLHRGVYAAGRAQVTQQGRWLAAVLACGPGAVLSHSSAGALLDLTHDRGAIDVSLPTRTGRRRRHAIRLHRVALHVWETGTKQAIPTTSPMRTLLDLADRTDIDRLITRSERLRLYDHHQLTACLTAHPHHPNAGKLRRALTTYEEPQLTDSVIEDLLLRICHDARLPTPNAQHPDGHQRLDFLFPDHGLIVEVDGWETHGTRKAFEDDRARDAEHLARGLRTLRFTRRQLVHQPDWVADVLRRALYGGPPVPTARTRAWT